MVFYPSSGDHCDLHEWDPVEDDRYNQAGELVGNKSYEYGYHQQLQLEAGTVLRDIRRIANGEEVRVEFDELTPRQSRRQQAALVCSRTIFNGLCPRFVYIPHETGRGTIERRSDVTPEPA